LGWNGPDQHVRGLVCCGQSIKLYANLFLFASQSADRSLTDLVGKHDIG